MQPEHALPHLGQTPGPAQLVDHPLLADLWVYWCAQRGVRALPRRSDIVPHHIPGLLRSLTIVERDDGGRFRYRLMGTAIVDAYGVDGRAKYLDQVLQEPLLGITKRNLAVVLGTQRPALARTRHLSTADVPYVATRLLLPLADEQNRATMILVGHDFVRDEEWMAAFTDRSFMGSLDELEIL